ncbi:dihydroorotase, partial [Chloroflexota bacterium]
LPPPLDSRVTINYIKSVVAKEGAVRVLPIGCVSKGRKGKKLVDMAELAAVGIVGWSDDGEPLANSRLMRRALDYSRTSGLPVIVHCEDTALTQGGQINEGTMSAKLGLRGMPAVAEEIIVARDMALAELTQGWLHVAHVSTAGSVELIRRAKEKGILVTAEVTPHHLTLTEEKVEGYNPNAKVNPPLRTEQDRQALIQGLRENVIDIIATDHAPHIEADKLGEFTTAPFGISGFETALGSLMSLVHNKQLDLVTLIAKLTSEPAMIISSKYEKLGTLGIGAPADVTIFDPEVEWVVDPTSFVSKGKNTPLAGSVLKGRVMATIFQGKLVYKDKSVRLEAKEARQTLV